MIFYERWLFIFITLATLPTTTSSRQSTIPSTQTKHVLPTIPLLFHGITCNYERNYSFRYLKMVTRLKATKFSEGKFFPHQFDIYDYTLRGPYYIYPLIFENIVYETGMVHIDHMVLNSDGLIMGGVVLEIQKYRKELVYHPCLPWDHKYKPLSGSSLESKLVGDLLRFES